MTSAFLYAYRHRLLARPLAEAELSVSDGERLGVDEHLQRAVGEQLRLPHPLQVDGHSNHPVGVVPGEVCLDEMVGDDLGFFFTAPGSDEESSHHDFEGLWPGFHRTSPLPYPCVGCSSNNTRSHTRCQ